MVRHSTFAFSVSLGSLFASVFMGLCLVLSPYAPYVALGASPALAKMPALGVHPAENGALLSVASGRISTAFEGVRAQRLAREQAVRKARYQLAKHIYKDKMSSPGTYSVQVEGARVVQEERQGTMYVVALLAHPQMVQLVARSPLEAFQEVTVAPLVDTLLTKTPVLADGGAQIFDVDAGWAGLGVGYAALPDVPQEADIKKARTIARAAAVKELTSFIFGVQFASNVEQKELHAQENGAEMFQQWIKNSTREDIDGMLKGAQLAGQWVTTDHHVGVAVVVAQPALDLAMDLEDEGAAKATLHKSDITEAWQKTILARPWIHEGGVSLCKHEGKMYVLAVESGKLQNNPTFDRMQLPIILDAKARNQITAFLTGLSTRAVTTSEEVQRTQLDTTEVSQHVQTLSRQGVSGVVTRIERIGSWYSKDDKTVYQAFVVALP